MNVIYDAEKIRQMLADFANQHVSRVAPPNYEAGRNVCVATVFNALTAAAETADKYGWTAIEFGHAYVTPKHRAENNTTENLVVMTWYRRDDGQPERSIRVQIAPDFKVSAS